MIMFDCWETELYHHGIKGMKWGVRRYQNEDGTLTSAGKARYGNPAEGEGYKKVSARKLARDYNNLDKGYANAVARKQRAEYVANKIAKKLAKNSAENSNGDFVVNGTLRDARRLNKSVSQYEKADRDMKSIESLQNRILSKAIAQGYTVNSKPVRRIGETGASKAASMLGGIVGGVLFSVATKTTHMSEVYGNKVKVTKKGDKHIRLYDKEGLSEYEKRRKGL